MTLSPETEILIKMLSDQSDWRCDGAISMTHKKGLRITCSRQGGTFQFFAQRGSVLLVPEKDKEMLAKDYFFPVRKIVEAREVIEREQA